MFAPPLEAALECRLGVSDAKNPVGYESLQFKIDSAGRPRVDW